MRNLASRSPESALSGYRPARAIRPAVTAVAEARQRHLSLVHAGTPSGGQRFDDPVPANPGLARRMKAIGTWLAAIGTLMLLLAA